MKKEARLLLDKAVNSLIISIEHFNRPWDQGRVEAVHIELENCERFSAATDRDGVCATAVLTGIVRVVRMAEKSQSMLCLRNHRGRAVQTENFLSSNK